MVTPDLGQSVTTDDLGDVLQTPASDTMAPQGIGLDIPTPDALLAPEPFSTPGAEETAQTPAVQPVFNPWTLGSASGNSTALRSRVISYGMSLIGLPYVWGGTSTTKGLDCSGLVMAAYGHFGVKMPRISYQQADMGQIVPLKGLQPGDLVAWDENGRNVGADHIAIYIGNGQILESPHTGATVRVRKLGSNEGAYGVHLKLPGDS